ncbi:MAG TPA: DNA-3-methyladenine glycosylase I [Acidobacteriaceae bacterium]|jgi:DNA-3-methyladenine glycosylase I|nr:DNA-3-methyladenine glycosylase I [Acidobacteriaceae bacterium]
MSTSTAEGRLRCAWAQPDPLLRSYHDTEWGVPEHDPRALWETLMLEGFQAGLSWIVVLRKRDTFRKAFANFDPEQVARFTESDILRLLQDPGIIRSRAKIQATINGARVFNTMQASGDDFARFAWSFVDGHPLQNSGPVPAQTVLSLKLSRELKRRGFKFVGPTIVYAWMQAVGLVNDHSPDCFRRLPVAKSARSMKAAHSAGPAR